MAGDPHDQNKPAGPLQGGSQPRRPRAEREVLAPPGRTRVPIGRRIATIAAGAVFGLLLFPLVYPIVNRLEGGSDGSSTTVADSPDAAASAGGSTSTSLVTLEPPASGPYLLVSVSEGQLTMSGIVPSEEVQQAIAGAATSTYGEFVNPQLSIDASAGEVPWFDTVADALPLMARSTTGSMLVANGAVQLSVEVSASAVADRMQSDIGNATGLPVSLEGMVVTNLEVPVLSIDGGQSQLSLKGKVPTEEIRSAVSAAATEVYGKGNISNQLVVDEGVHTALWMYSPRTLFDALYVFPDVEITLEGETVTGRLRGGYSFTVGSEEAIADAPGVTGFVVDLMNRDPSLQMVISAHTDSAGQHESNMALSQGRADFVLDTYREAGVEESRMTAVGKAFTDPVIEDEQSDEDKARNRRIDVQLSTVAG
jgi:outer membrane protein OmpA-like peptidoglycan-associated protein